MRALWKTAPPWSVKEAIGWLVSLVSVNSLLGVEIELVGLT
jgi:hypothetical protein